MNIILQCSQMGGELRPCSDLVPFTGYRARALKRMLFRQRQRGKRIKYRKIGNKFEVRTSTAWENVNTAGADENLFILVPVPGHSARALPLKLVPLPGNGAQISARASTKAMFRLVPGNRARALKWTFFSPACAGNLNVHKNNQGKVITIQKSKTNLEM